MVAKGNHQRSGSSSTLDERACLTATMPPLHLQHSTSSPNIRHTYDDQSSRSPTISNHKKHASATPATTPYVEILSSQNDLRDDEEKEQNPSVVSPMPRLETVSLGESDSFNETSTLLTSMELGIVDNWRLPATKTSPPAQQTKISPGSQLVRLWLLIVALPSTVAWLITHQIVVTVAALFIVPVIAILQGSIAILRYRLKYGNSPLPKAPSRGIIRCQGMTSSAASTCSAHVETDEQDTALRLLVIGDSLAIGVGQTSSSTPIMPESIAKSLSKSMGGRPVLWTCHGAPGASAGWIVRELERSIQQGQFVQSVTGPGHHPTVLEMGGVSKESHGMNQPRNDTDLNSDDSSSESALEEETRTWQERLRQQRVQFDPNVVGPFDIAVVLTGSNDLKSAFFPFLLTGEDAEFRRQAQLRGGGYGKELNRILHVLNRRMRRRLQTIRESVEVATERLRERLSSTDAASAARENQCSDEVADGSFGPTARPNKTSPRNSSGLDNDVMVEETCGESHDSFSAPQHHYPMIVLPGMPARALPIFENAPLRWLAIPIVDKMDWHKRRLAEQHHGEVLFVDAPTATDIRDYAEKKSVFWRQQQEDQLILNLRDIKPRHAERIQIDMHRYSLKQEIEDPASLPYRKRHFSMFSVDGIHPNDQGYIFWGRYIANSIVKEWDRTQQRYAGVVECT